jgi:hypothetical protein
MIAATALTWVWIFLGYVWWTPPSTTRFVIPWVITGVVAGVLIARAVRRPMSGAFFRRWWGAIAGCTVLFLAVSTQFAVPVGPSRFFLFLVLVPVAFVVLVAGLAGLRRRPMPSAVAVLSMAGLCAFTAADTAGIHDAGLRFRVRLVSDGWARDAARVLANPATDADPSSRKPFKAGGQGGSVVAWSLVEGLAFHAWGLVYDPDAVLSGGATVQSKGYPFVWSARGCDAVIDDWYWCKLT